MRDWIASFAGQRWGAPVIVAHGCVYDLTALPGFAAFDGQGYVGLITYSIQGPACEIVSLDSVYEKRGIGTALIEAVKAVARRAGCQRLWLVTTNDNLNALRFYQKRGFKLVAIYRDAVEQARKLKPQIPLVGEHGIPVRDEIELELPLTRHMP
ncbi:MAG: GNAT family N-acetyltransferase [Ktedonobacteraceae bacterium]|nr:GNAT family N-acetyltransferase [Ktedonobacteraceae bacterium]